MSRGLTHGEVEAVVHREGMELLRGLTQGHRSAPGLPETLFS